MATPITALNAPRNYLPLHTTHILLGLIWAGALIGLNGIELYFLPNSFWSSTALLFLVFQNIGIGIANAYWATNISVTASGIQETTGKTTPPSP